jgi:hypothetical protein
MDNAYTFVSTFAFLPTLEPTQKKQKSFQATAPKQTCMDRQLNDMEKARTANSTYPKAGFRVPKTVL